jgi:hypothetical protein
MRRIVRMKIFICLKGVFHFPPEVTEGENRENLRQDNRLRRDWNSEGILPKYKCRALLLHQPVLYRFGANSSFKYGMQP